MAQQYFALAKYRVTQHYLKGLEGSMRLNWFIDGEVLLLDVLNINAAPGFRQYQVILAKDSEQ